MCGAAGGVTTVAATELIDAYRRLRTLLQKKYGENSILLRSIGTLEQKPESKTKQEGVAEDVVDCGADKDPEVQDAANQLLDLLKEVQPEVMYNATLNGSGAIAQGKGAVAAGAGGIAVGGINMPESKG
jgi:hypothetical protein